MPVSSTIAAIGPVLATTSNSDEFSQKSQIAYIAIAGLVTLMGLASAMYTAVNKYHNWKREEGRLRWCRRADRSQDDHTEESAQSPVEMINIFEALSSAEKATLKEGSVRSDELKRPQQVHLRCHDIKKFRQSKHELEESIDAH